MRILLDTNIVVSALLWQGAPHHLLGAIQRQLGVQLFSSTALLEELADVLGRPSVAKRLALIARTPADLLADYVEAIELVESAEVKPVVVADPDDDQVIAAAVAARVDFIVSGDRRHLLPLGSHQGIAIIEAAEALRRLAARTA